MGLSAAALGYLVMYGALVAVLFVGPEVGSGLGWAHDTIRSYLVAPLAGQGDRLSFMTARERSHLRDVKVLFDAALVGAVISVVVLGVSGILLRRRPSELRRSTGRVLWYAGIGTIAAVALLGLAALLDFGRFWEAFHEVLFPQGNWRFAFDDVLIRIYPTSYFEAFVLRWTVVVVVISVLLAWGGRRLSREDVPREPSGAGDLAVEGRLVDLERQRADDLP
jgi:integral membrane protein (TIGR01906 family)